MRCSISNACGLLMLFITKIIIVIFLRGLYVALYAILKQMTLQYNEPTTCLLKLRNILSEAAIQLRLDL